MGKLQYSEVQVATAQSNLTTIAPYMFWLMFRNVASDGFVFEDPGNTHALSQPGCVLASPSWENTATNVNQDYVYNWTRDAAIVAIELAAGAIPTGQPLIDYVQFAQISRTQPAPSVTSIVRRSSSTARRGSSGPTRPTGPPCRRWRSWSCSPSSTRRRRPWRTP
jgi:hypothetical protein